MPARQARGRRPVCPLAEVAHCTLIIGHSEDAPGACDEAAGVTECAFNSDLARLAAALADLFQPWAALATLAWTLAEQVFDVYVELLATNFALLGVPRLDVHR